MTEYEYYPIFQKCPNTNTKMNIIRIPKKNTFQNT